MDVLTERDCHPDDTAAYSRLILAAGVALQQIATNLGLQPQALENVLIADTGAVQFEPGAAGSVRTAPVRVPWKR